MALLNIGINAPFGQVTPPNVTLLGSRAELYEPDLIKVKFKDAYQVRLRKRQLTDLSGQAFQTISAQRLLSRMSDCTWLRQHRISEKKLDQFRKRGLKQRAKLSDLNNYFVLVLPPERNDLESLLAQLNKLKEVEFAERVHKPVPPPSPPDFSDLADPTLTASQLYLGPSTANGGSNGVDAFFAWTQSGGDGAGVSICDIEYDWNFNHAEFNSSLTLIGDSPLNPFEILSKDHGTSVVAVYGSRSNNSVGTKGISFSVNKLAATVVPARLIPWWDIAGAITAAMDAMNPGDIILIEQHMPGPNTPSDRPVGSQEGFVPVEWDRANYDAIITATANGYIVVEAAGNGAVNLDALVYRSGDHRPFVAVNDSGAILVGAGNSLSRAKLEFSNFGSRVNVQGWGRNVVTAASDPAQADLWDADGPNQLYKSSFSGTSSASPIVAGCCACIQGVFRSQFGRSATPREMRDLLINTGRAQSGSEHIGPLPDLRSALNFLSGATPRFPDISPQSGTYPVPLEISIFTPFGGVHGQNFKTLYTLDDTEPQESGGSAQENVEFEPIVLSQAGDVALRVKTFCTDTFTGERVAGPTGREVYRLYAPALGPANLRATQAAHVDKVVITWDGLPNADYYDVFGGTVNHPFKLNQQPVVGLSFDDTRFPGEGDHRSYFVRARTGDRITQMSGPAVGWTSLQPLMVQASDGQFPDHVLVSWSYPIWNPFVSHIEFKIFKASTPDFTQATEIHSARMRSRPVVVAGRVIQVPDGIDMEYKDFQVASGTTYYYWATVIDSYSNLQTPPGHPEGGYII